MLRRCHPHRRRFAGLASGAVALLAAATSRADIQIVFASRSLGANPDDAARQHAIERATSGRLLVRESSDWVRTLVDARAEGAAPETPVDVMDPDVSWDGNRIVFAGYSRQESAWRIYEVGADGKGLRQLTRSDRRIDLGAFGEGGEAALGSYDDVDPCYLPDERICFVSTRYPTVAPDGRLRGTNLYVINSDGSDLHRITTERFGADTPAVDPATGMIVYSRWWRSSIFNLGPSTDPTVEPPPVDPGSPGYGDIVSEPPVDGVPLLPIRAAIDEKDFPGLNNWFLADIRPDGSGMAMRSGMGLDRQATQAWRPSFLADGRLAALFIPRTPFLGLPRGDGLRILARGAVAPTALGGPQTFARGEKPGLLYAGAERLVGDIILLSAARPEAPGDYDLYTQRLPGDPVLFQALPGTAELGAVAILPRLRPPVLADVSALRLVEQPPASAAAAFASGGSFRFVVENIFGNGPVGMAVANAPPLVPDLTIDFFMNPQRTGLTAPDAPILIASRPIDPTGRVEVELPAGVPLFEVLRTPSGRIPVGRDGQIFHVGGHNFGTPGKTARCIGCHVGHSMLEVPADPAWTNLAPGAQVTASSSRVVPEKPDENSLFFVQRPENLVDRKVAGLRAEWASEAPSAAIQLSWPLPIRARELVLHAPAPGPGVLGPRDQTIRSFLLVRLLGGQTIERRQVTVPISANGTRVPLSSSQAFDRLQLVIQATDVQGLYEGKPAPAIAEIEVIGRAAGSVGPIPFQRGDADCDGLLRITDPIRVLDWLFTGAATVCCQAAADADATGVVNLGDAIYLLGYLFLGGPEPAAPFPGCGPGVATELSCDGPTPCPSG